MEGSPLVSVVVPTYNRPDRLERAVRSVIAQTYENIELVVVDDHSDQPVESVIEELPTDELGACRYVRHEENRGGGAARNTGIAEATGEFVAFLDDDDRWRPEKIDRQVSVFQEAGPDVGVVYTGRRVVDDSGEQDHVPPRMEGDPTKSLLCKNVVESTSVVMVRSDCIDKAGPFDERFPSWQELEWYVRLSLHCTFELVPLPLVVYDTTGDDRITDDFDKVKRGYELFVEKHEPLAAEYGWLFSRKMLAWAAFRAGENAIGNGRVWEGRKYVNRAMWYYPFEWTFAVHFLAVLGGPSTLRIARRVRDFASSFLAVED